MAHASQQKTTMAVDPTSKLRGSTPSQTTSKREIFTSTMAHTSQQETTMAVACYDRLGMENGDIIDENIQASSEFIGMTDYRPENGRLNNNKCWSAAKADTEGWIQADIGYQTYVSGVITQGGSTDDWVTSFKVSTFLEATGAEEFVTNIHGAEIFQGNTDANTEVTNMFLQPVIARIVRIICTDKNDDHYSMRFEILGCKKN